MTVNGDVFASGDLTMANNSTVSGSVTSLGSVTTSNNTTIAGDVHAADNVTLNNCVDARCWAMSTPAATSRSRAT